MPQILDVPQITLDSNFNSYIERVDINYAHFRDFYRDLDVDKNRCLEDVSVYLSSLALVDSKGESILAARPSDALDGEILDPLTPEKTDIIVFLGSCVNTGHDPAYVLGSELAKVVCEEMPTALEPTKEPPISIENFDKMTALSRLRLRALARTGILFGSFVGLKDLETFTHHDVPYSIKDIGLQAVILSTIMGLVIRGRRKRELADIFDATSGPYADRLTIKPRTNTDKTMNREAIDLNKKRDSCSPTIRILGVDSPRIDRFRKSTIIQLS
jgi:hypothetical protein